MSERITHARQAKRFDTLTNALRRAVDWRLLSLWLVGMLLPTLLVAVPVWRTLAAALDRNPMSAEVARHFDMLTLEDLRPTFQHAGPALLSTAILAIISAIVISPLLTAAVMAVAADGGHTPGATLLQRALAWYRRSFRIRLLLLIPIALVTAVGLALLKSAGDYAERATLESRADLASHLALVATALLAVLLHASIEAGRAELAADPSRHSVWAAWLRGTRKAVQRPLDTLVLYLGPTLLSLLLAGLFALLRVHVGGATPLGFGSGVLLTQVSVASVGWGRVSRLLALTTLFRSEEPS